MEHSTSSSIEEGEACFYEEDDANIDLSYIDQKIQNVLGHFQKDFEGGVSAENLGAKFGGYGSFLPTYERSPLRPPKAPQRNQKIHKSPVNVQGEGLTKTFTASKTPSLGRLGIASRGAKLLHTTKVLSADGAVNDDSTLLSAQIAEKPPWINETVTVHPNMQRNTKIRIKLSSDNKVQKNAAIYSGLGLYDSPSSSLGNSPEISGGVPSEYREASDESPTNILQTMTSFPVFGGLLSPLHNNMLCLTSKGRLSKSGPVLISNQESAVKLADWSGSPTRVLNPLKEKKTGIVDNIDRLKENGNATGSENLITVLSNEKMKMVTSKSKNFVSKKLKLASPANLKCGINASTDGTDRADDISREANKDGLKGSSFSSILEKEDPLWLQGSCKIERVNANHTSGYNSFEKVAYDHNELQFDVDVSKDRETLNARSRDLSKQKFGHKTAFQENKGITVSYRLGKKLFEGKNKLEFQSKVKQVAAAEKSLSVSLSVALKDKNDISNGVHPSKSKTHKLKKQKDRTKNLERHLGNRTKGSHLDYIDKEPDAFYDYSMEQSASGKVQKKSVFEVSLKEAPKGALTNNVLASELVPPLTAPVLIEEDWVGCDNCQKWRLLPYGTKPKQLPEKWLCSMLNWLPGMNRCEISEEETTNALHALYQCPAPEISINPLKPVDETALDITSINGYLDQNQFITTREINKYKRKENTNADSSSGRVRISNSKKNNHQEYLKSRSLNVTNQILVESSLLKNSPELAMGKNESKHKKLHMNRDDVKQANRVEKRKSDQFDYGEPKKVKRENFGSDLYCHSEIEGGIGRVGLSPFAKLSTKATGRSMQKSACVSSLKNSNCSSSDMRSFSVKKLNGESHFSLDGGSPDLGLCDSRDDSLKKRKINDRRDNQPIEGSPYPDRKASKLVNDSGEFRKEKKIRISKVEGNESSTNKGSQRENEKGRVPKIIISVNGDHPVNGIEEMNSDEVSQLQRQKNKVAPLNLAEGIDLLNRNCGSRYVTAETTSSSSKVSGLRISKSKLQEVRGSPVESVSSSPLRNSYPGQVAPERGEKGGKSGAGNGDIHTRANRGKFVNGEGNDGSNRSGRTIKDNDYRFLPNESTENSTLDYREQHNKKLDRKSKPSVHIQISHLVSGDVDTIGHHIRSSMEHDRTNLKKNSFNDTPEKSDKGLCLQSKDKDETFRSDFDRNKMKVCNPTSEQEALDSRSLRNDRDIDPNHTAKCKAKVSGLKVCFPNNHSKNDKNQVRDKESVGNCSNDSTKENVEQDGSYRKLDAQYSKNVKCNQRQDLIPNTVVRELFTHHEGKKETLDEDLNHGPLSEANTNVTRASKQLQSADECPLSNRQMVKDLYSSSPVSKDPTTQNFCNTLKEAKDHKHFADSLKSSGFGVESSVAYFQAALKFLLAASILETCNSGKHGDITPIQLYISTAKLCESCAHEYEGHQEVAAAALSYKCMEVAYMRAVYCKHLTSSRDRDELQATLQMHPLGESPSSSVSDVDNLTLSKGCGSHITGQHVIASQNRPNFIRILDFTQYVSLAMETSTKSQKAFAAANILLKQRHNKEGIDFLKRVVDFSFQDVEGFIRLVQLAMEAISHSGHSGTKD